MTQQRRFTKEFEEEAVRLVQTSGRTQREIAGDLGIGLSTLVSGEGCRGGVEAAAAGEQILRQERDILKKATAFFVREGSR
jgi:transposase